MKLSSKPRIVYIADPDYGNRPYPYVFANIPNALEAMGLQVLYINPATVTVESFRREIDLFKPEVLFGFIQNGQQIVKIARFLTEYHPVATINWYQEEPNCVVGTSIEDDVLEASRSFDMWFGIDKNMFYVAGYEVPQYPQRQ